MDTVVLSVDQSLIRPPLLLMVRINCRPLGGDIFTPLTQFILAGITPLTYIIDMRFIRTKRYQKDLRRIGATEAEADAVEISIAADPTAGDVISELRGVRKIRFGLRGKGKRGGGRAIYVLMVSDDLAIMIMAYTKNEQSDLTQHQRKAILSLLEEFGK